MKKKKLFIHTITIILIFILGIAIVYSYIALDAAISVLKGGRNWVLVMGLVILIFPWELLSNIPWKQRISSLARVIYLRTKKMMPTNKALLKVLPRIALWWGLYALGVYILNYAQNYLGVKIIWIPVLNLMIENTIFKAVTFVLGAVIVRATITAFFGVSITGMFKKYSAFNEYPRELLVGTFLTLGITIIILFNFALDRTYETITIVVNPTRLYATSSLGIFIDELHLSSKSVSGEAVFTGDYPAIQISDGQTIYQEQNITPLSLRLLGDNYTFPFSQYKFAFYPSPQNYVNGTLTEVDDAIGEFNIFFIEKSRIFDIKHDSRNNNVVLVYSSYYKMVVTTVFLVLLIFFVAILKTNDKNTVFELSIGVFASIIAMRGFLIPTELEQPLLIDQLLLTYIILLMIVLLLKLYRNPNTF